MLGPVLPQLIARWNMPDAQLGTLFVASFLGQLSGAALSVRLLRPSFIAGAAVTALGCLWMSSAAFYPAHIAIFLIGIGLGAGLTAGNVLVGNLDSRKRSRYLALLNMAWSAGAIACPLLVHASLKIAATGTAGDPAGLRPFFLILAAGLTCSTLLSAALVRPSAVAACTTAEERLSPRTFLYFLVVLMLYIGVENALGGWLPTFARRSLPQLSQSDVSSSIALCFWMAQLTGRGLTALLVRSINERLLYRLSIGGLILTTAMLCYFPRLNAPALFLTVAATALFLAPLFPLAVSFLLARAGRQPRLGPLFASSALGGALLPWLTGVVSTHFYGLRAGLTVPLAAALGLLALSATLPSRPLPLASQP